MISSSVVPGTYLIISSWIRTLFASWDGHQPGEERPLLEVVWMVVEEGVIVAQQPVVVPVPGGRAPVLVSDHVGGDEGRVGDVRSPRPGPPPPLLRVRLAGAIQTH